MWTYIEWILKVVCEEVNLLDLCPSEITCCRALRMEQSGCGVFKPLLV